ncbi:MAG TPA: UvrD-helicase domain-containing protein [Xanthobacteraceae bacterium]|nr:UvrD-helicase domain-containing protein [Xanthobacteraceae bacterium]
MRFHADLHVHSKYSRATSRDLDLEHLAYWAARKGIGVVATGDFTHPAWAAELRQKLVPAEPGLFRLRDDIETAVAEKLPAACRRPVRFLLEVEISTIYKKAERTRKIHHLIYAPDLATVERISARLARIGNIASDGRPILGLDSRDLLEITLESSPDAYLVPAHIWTPWFAALGSQSGFDSITDCYGDLADHIFAVETGLSSDPPMNWRLSMLDRYRLTSNSDAHSPGKLGREATTFDCDPDYFAIRRALETGEGYVGTVEFFPDEGKYHLDGHRKCGVRLTPTETLAHGGRCPACGAPVTVGVEHRVEALADRSEAEAQPPATAGSVSNLVPLPEILSEITQSGAATKTVEQGYNRVLASLGPELALLQEVPVEDIGRAGSSLLAEAVGRLRAGQVIRDPGYDGEYGVIRLFHDGELERRGGLLFDAPMAKRTKAAAPRVPPGPPPPERGRWTAQGSGRGLLDSAMDPHPAPSAPTSPLQGEVEFVGPPSTLPLEIAEPAAPEQNILAALDPDQRAAAEIVDGPLLIAAGPGSGKTRALTHRIAHLVAERGMAAENCLAITFTRRAAAELRERLAQLIPDAARRVPIHTFHSLGLTILREHPDAAGLQRGFRIAGEAERADALAAKLNIASVRAQRLLRAISKAKRTQTPIAADQEAALAAYAQVLALRDWIDFDDVIALALRALDNGLAAHYRERFRWISVDEFQDTDEQQYGLLTRLAPPRGNLCVIGDANQAIYGFRGADSSCFERFRHDYEPAVVSLRRNYRSSGTIVAASSQIISVSDAGIATIVRDMHEHITIHTAPTERAEAEFIIQTIEGLLGGHTFFSIDSGRAGRSGANLSFADIAVLHRTEAQATALREAFARSGIPFKSNAHSRLADDPAVQALLRQLDDSSDGPLAAQFRDAVPRAVAADGIDAAAIDTALRRLTTLAEMHGPDRGRFLDAVAVASEADFFEDRADSVSLLTLHAAKGLEFAVVFIVGLEDGLLPLHWGDPDDATIAEERRLFYVGMTRAKDSLFLSRALARHWRGRVRQLAPSPFLADIESELTKHQRNQHLRRKPDDKQLKLF